MNFVLSAIAPETIVAAVAQNTILNTKLCHGNSAKFVNKSRFGRPIRPKNASSPIIRPKPRTINTTVPIQKSIRFFIMIFAAFLARVKPVSTIAKPHCIKKTSAAPIRNHTPSVPKIVEFTASIILLTSIFIPS